MKLKPNGAKQNKRSKTENVEAKRNYWKADFLKKIGEKSPTI